MKTFILQGVKTGEEITPENALCATVRQAQSIPRVGDTIAITDILGFLDDFDDIDATVVMVRWAGYLHSTDLLPIVIIQVDEETAQYCIQEYKWCDTNNEDSLENLQKDFNQVLNPTEN